MNMMNSYKPVVRIQQPCHVFRKVDGYQSWGYTFIETIYLIYYQDETMPGVNRVSGNFFKALFLGLIWDLDPWLNFQGSRFCSTFNVISKIYLISFSYIL